MSYLSSYLVSKEVSYIILLAREGIWFREETLDIAFDLLYDMNERGYFLLFGFCLLPCEFHIILRPEKGRGLKGITQGIKMRITKMIKLNKNISFPIWKNGFGVRQITSRDELLSILSHIHGLPKMVGLTYDPKRYRYSSLYPGNITDLDALW